MESQSSAEETHNRPTVLGTGLIALDIVFGSLADGAPHLWAGGTCANVLTILSYLGWNAFPVARIGSDDAAAHVLQDMEDWGVDLKYTSLGPAADTPIFIQRIKRNLRGEVVHTFSSTCPICGGWLPRYKPVRASEAAEVGKEIETPKVFFFDRLSRGSVNLAKECFHKGALVIFEPASVKEPSLFREALTYSHILKYAHERMGGWREIEPTIQPLIEIETLGEQGLRYRSNASNARTLDWVHLDVVKSDVVKDTSGAGDWCTAGIIDRLGREGAANLNNLPSATLKAAIRYGQALAAWNCGYEGARGGMYETSRRAFSNEVAHLLLKDKVRTTTIQNFGQHSALTVCIRRLDNMTPSNCLHQGIAASRAEVCVL